MRHISMLMSLMPSLISIRFEPTGGIAIFEHRDIIALLDFGIGNDGAGFMSSRSAHR